VVRRAQPVSLGDRKAFAHHRPASTGGTLGHLSEIKTRRGISAQHSRDTLALLDAGFPRSRAEVESRFNILEQSTTNGSHSVTLQPKAEAARRIMPRIKIIFDTNTFSLQATELQFADGSTMENAFTNTALNPTVDESVFTFATNGFKIVHPFNK
jgi:outer membrane lipoprotein-sorting protein